MNLLQIVKDEINRLGKAKAASVLGTNVGKVGAILSDALNPSISVLQKLLDNNPTLLSAAPILVTAPLAAVPAETEEAPTKTEEVKVETVKVGETIPTVVPAAPAPTSFAPDEEEAPIVADGHLTPQAQPAGDTGINITVPDPTRGTSLPVMKALTAKPGAVDPTAGTTAPITAKVPHTPAVTVKKVQEAPKVEAPVVKEAEAVPVTVADAYNDMPWAAGKNLIVLCPTNRSFNPAVVRSMLGIKTDKIGFIVDKISTLLVEGRNELAHQFLFGTQARYSYWWDDDNILPYGDAEWYNRIMDHPQVSHQFAGLHAIRRFIQTSMAKNNAIVGGIYNGRAKNGQPMTQLKAMSQPDLAKMVARGPHNAVYPAEFVATGSALVPREAYFKIAEKFPELEVNLPNYKYDFFRPLKPGWGEDVSFCHRAREAGVEVFADAAIMPGHIGGQIFTFNNTMQ